MAFNAFALLENTFFFLTLLVTIAAIIGFASGSFNVGAFSGGIMFFSLGLLVDYDIYTQLMYVLIVVIAIITSFQIYGITQNNQVN